MRNLLPCCIALSLVAACGGDDPACRSGRDCPSGVCLSDGTCGAAPDAGHLPDASLPDAHVDADAGIPDDDAGSSPDDAGVLEDGGEGFDAGLFDAGEPDGGEVPDASVPDGGEPPVCAPNHDGEITRSEIVVAPGQRATFRVAEDVQVDTQGVPASGGGWLWDLSGALAGDFDAQFEVFALDGLWFASTYPGATYASPMSASGEILGVFELTDDALLLRGMASAVDGPSRTLLTYDPPVKVLSFPIQQGASWSTVAAVEGEFEGSTLYFVRHTYESQVDAAGELRTPLGSFRVQRIKVVHQQQTLYWGVWTTLNTIRSYSFVAECFGTAASITSQDHEYDDDFTEAAEVRRLAP